MSYRKSVITPRARASALSATAQVLPLPNRADMVRNSAGGMVFSVGPWERLRRFLILGADGPTYYASAKTLTLQNVDSLMEALALDGLRVVREIEDISVGGRAPRNDAALFALALASAWGVKAGEGKAKAGATREAVLAAGNGDVAGSAEVRRAAFAALPRVARTGTHIMQFADSMASVRGWGQAPLKAFRAWFTEMGSERLALQAVKYRQRGGWTLRDLLRLSHPKPSSRRHAVLFDWMAHRGASADEVTEVRSGFGGKPSFGDRVVTPRRHALRPTDTIVADARLEFRVVDGYHLAQEATSSAAAAKVIRSHSVPFEAVRPEHLDDKAVWDALLVDMPMTNMIRNLGRMSGVGLLTEGSDAARYVASRLADREALIKARVHPLALLTALKVYASGRAIKGSLSWKPATKVRDALDAAFYLAFEAVRPTGKRHLLGVDISGSMDQGAVAGSPMTPREGAAAMAMVTFMTEPDCSAWGFTSSGGYGRGRGLTEIPMSRRIRLDDLCKQMQKMPMGGTDASLPIRKALEEKLSVDAFVIYTDNETWAGKAHVSELLRQYRDKSGINARLVAVGMTATDFSVVDPEDAGQMNVVGFDSSAPAVISAFVEG